MNQTHKLHLSYLYQSACTSVKNNPWAPVFFENLLNHWTNLPDGTIHIPLQNLPIFVTYLGVRRESPQSSWRGRPGLASRWHLASGREQGQDALATAMRNEGWQASLGEAWPSCEKPSPSYA